MVPLEADDVEEVLRRVSDHPRRSSVVPLFEDDPVSRRVRLSRTIPHNMRYDENHNKRCVLCHFKCHCLCISCGVRLCPKTRPDQATTCQDMFHSHGVCLKDVKKQFSKARKDREGGDGDEGGGETAEGAPAAAAAAAASAETNQAPADDYRTPATGRRRGRPSRGSSRSGSQGSRSSSSLLDHPAAEQPDKEPVPTVKLSVVLVLNDCNSMLLLFPIG